MKYSRSTMAGLCLIAAVLITLSCGGKDSSNPSAAGEADRVWYNGVDTTAYWIDVDDNCGKLIPITQDKADSICQAFGYAKAAGYDPYDCYASGVKDTYLECVACTFEK